MFKEHHSLGESAANQTVHSQLASALALPLNLKALKWTYYAAKLPFGTGLVVFSELSGLVIKRDMVFWVFFASSGRCKHLSFEWVAEKVSVA